MSQKITLKNAKAQGKKVKRKLTNSVDKKKSLQQFFGIIWVLPCKLKIDKTLPKNMLLGKYAFKGV